MVQLSCEIKAISAPSWGLAGWLGMSLAIISARGCPPLVGDWVKDVGSGLLLVATLTLFDYSNGRL